MNLPVKKHTVATLLAALVTLVAIPWGRWVSLQIIKHGEEIAKLRLEVFGVARRVPATMHPPPVPSKLGSDVEIAMPVPKFPATKGGRP